MERSGDPRTETREATGGEIIPGNIEPGPDARALCKSRTWVELFHFPPRKARRRPNSPSRSPPPTPTPAGDWPARPRAGRRLALPAGLRGLKRGAGARCPAARCSPRCAPRCPSRALPGRAVGAGLAASRGPTPPPASRQRLASAGEGGPGWAPSSPGRGHS